MTSRVKGLTIAAFFVITGALSVFVAARTRAQAPTPPRTTTPSPSPSAATPATDPILAFRKGEYESALLGAQRDVKLLPHDAVRARLLVRILAEQGRYEEAARAAHAFINDNPKSPELDTTLALVLVKQGETNEAQTLLAKAIKDRATDALLADASLSRLYQDRGQAPEALAGFERLIAAYNAGRARSASDLIGVGIACRELGATNPDAFKDALKAFDEAAGAPSNALEDFSHDARVATGQLFLDKFNGSDARESFDAVLSENPRHPEALVGMARALDFDGERGVPDLLERALATNPNSAEAHAQMSQLKLALEDFSAANAHAQAALASNSSSLEGLSSLAAVQFLSDDRPGFEATIKKAETAYPKSGELFVTVAEAAVRNRLYAEARDLAMRALKNDAQSWAALASLGQNQLRLGNIAEGRKSLEASFKGDPYNVWVKNTLDLLDTFGKYETTSDGQFDLFLDAKESPAFAPLVGTLAREAIAKLSERYGFSPQGTIRIEAYPSHADFSVRSVGLAGLGALGVCFGPVVVIDSPSARDRGTFNWGSTLWHELTHVVTMGASSNRVPRWLTEGISVYEERRARPGWGDDLSIEFLMAYARHELLDLKDLNNGFLRPTRPEQVGISYYQSSLVVEHIEGAHGIEGLRALLRAYGKGLSPQAAFETALKKTMDEVDASFKSALKAKVEKAVAGIRTGDDTKEGTRDAFEARASKDENDFIAHVALGQIYAKERRFDEALIFLRRASVIWPESTGSESPYPLLAKILKDRKDTKGAIEALRTFTRWNEINEETRLDLATLLEGEGDLKGALDTLDEAVFISPFEAKTHERRVELATRLGDKPRALGVRRTLAALSPSDPAEAYYQLALAEWDAGDAAAARKSVLKALEMAPRFARAQELLLQIHRGQKQ